MDITTTGSRSQDSVLLFVFNYRVKRIKKNEANMNSQSIEEYIEANQAFSRAKRLRNTWFVISGTAWIIDIVHVGIYTSRYNKGTLKYPPKPRKKVSIYPSYDPINNQVGVLLTCNL